MADIDQLFATFRAEAGTEIRPPGSDVARRTVRRRRSVRLAATALAVVAVVAVGFVVRPGAGGPTATGAAPGSRPTPSLNQENQLGVEALAILGYAPTDTPARPDLRPVRPGVVFGGMGASTEFSYRFGTPTEPLPPGAYRLQAVCRGQGVVRVAWGQPGLTSSTEFECGEYFVDDVVVIDARGLLDIVITPSNDAVGRSGVAVALTDTRLVAARNALGVPTRTPMSEGEAVLYEPLMNVDETPIAAGGHRLSVACAGRGTVEATLAAGPTSQSGSLVCTPAGALTELTVAAPAAASLTVTIEPDATATGQAAVVYRVTKA
jgi:hypothetical protein